MISAKWADAIHSDGSIEARYWVRVEIKTPKMPNKRTAQLTRDEAWELHNALASLLANA